MQTGRIEVIVGPMFAGKTTELLRRIDRAELARRRVCIMKYAKDQRYSAEKVSTHDYSMHDAIPCAELMPHIETCRAYDVIGIDEGQFFPDLVPFCDELANNGKTVIVAALDGDFQRKSFGHVLELLSKCESLTKLTAVCRVTGGDACYTKRTVQSTELELIGGAEAYTAASRSAMKGIDTTGEINLTIGPVKSGKTKELLRCLNRYVIAGRRVLLLKSSEAHEELPKKPNFEIRYVTDLPDPKEIIGSYDVVGVDDGQLFENIAAFADELADHNTHVFVAAMDGDQDHIPYPNIIQLFPFAEKCNKLDSVCPITGLPAPFTSTLDGIKLFPISRRGLLDQLNLVKALSVNA